MPIYEYRCTAHGHQFDLLQPVGSPAPACPICGSPSRKVYSSVGIVFKGSGFHVTDYRRPAVSDGTSGDGKGKDESPAPASSKAGGSEGAGAGTTGTSSTS